MRRAGASRGRGARFFCNLDFMPTMGSIVMMFSSRVATGLLLTLLTRISFSFDDNYGYAIENPLVATVIGTPREQQAHLDRDIKYQLFKLKAFRERVTPKYFWYNDKITYGLLRQKHKAPLIFVIAGTGGNYRGELMTTVASAFYSAGFHVVSLPSPTYMSFIIAASKSSVPGLLYDDSKDLYRVMKLAWEEQLQWQIEVSDFYVTGYSLGGAQAAYTAYIDEREKYFDFHKALVLNTPVSLFNSVEILDNYLEESLRADRMGREFGKFWRQIWGDLSKVYADSTKGRLELTPEFLLEVYKKRNLNDRDLKLLVGAAFRISAASMMVTADVMSRSGFVVPVGTTATINADVEDFFIVSHRTGFMEYARGLMLPFYQRYQPQLSFEKLKWQASLYPIEDYLRNSRKIGLIHNADDIIMAEGEIDWLREVFGDRARIYPRGGHLGNAAYKDNVAYMVDFIRD